MSTRHIAALAWWALASLAPCSICLAQQSVRLEPPVPQGSVPNADLFGGIGLAPPASPSVAIEPSSAPAPGARRYVQAEALFLKRDVPRVVVGTDLGLGNVVNGGATELTTKEMSFDLEGGLRITLAAR